MRSFLITFVLAITAVQSCDISPKVSLSLPSNNQTAFTKPNSRPSSIFLAVGVRSYACSTAGEYVSDGVTGKLYDVSCYTQIPQSLKTIQDQAYKEWNDNSSLSFLAHLLRGNLSSEISSTGIRLVLDYKETVKNPESYVVADIVVSVPSPSGPGNIDWSQLKGDSALASQIYQTDTKGGSPHGSCKPGSTSEEKFSATFWLYGGASPNTTLPTSFTNDTPIRNIALSSNVSVTSNHITPTADVGEPQTPTTDVGKPQTPTTDVGKPQTPTTDVGKPQTPTTGVGKPHTPTTDVSKPQTPTTGVGKPQTPTTGVVKPHTPTTVVGKPHTVTKFKTRTKHHTFTKNKIEVKYHTTTDKFISMTSNHTTTATVTKTINSTTTNVVTATTFTTPSPLTSVTVYAYATTFSMLTVMHAPPPP